MIQASNAPQIPQPIKIETHGTEIVNGLTIPPDAESTKYTLRAATVGFGIGATDSLEIEVFELSRLIPPGREAFFESSDLRNSKGTPTRVFVNELDFVVRNWRGQLFIAQMLTISALADLTG
jgi:hypothetical protein